MRSSFRVFIIAAASIFCIIAPAFILPSDGGDVAVDSPISSVLVSPDSKFDSIRTVTSEYEWPTDASRVVTSTFAEFRTTHFHAGIDISTNNRSGYKILAARDGYVSRVRVSPQGYGKMLYVRHADGYVTTYAHLKTFSNQINSMVREKQFRQEKYPVDIRLDPNTIKVHKGDVIAYSGRSGTGEPHLHFEIRDENLNPVNPLLFEHLTVVDDLSPVIRALAFTPVGPYSSIEKKNNTVLVRRFSRKGKTYSAPNTVVIEGMCGISINVRDAAEGTRHRVGVHQLSLSVDDRTLYSVQLNRVDADESKQILLYYDLTLLKHGSGRFQKLYVEPGSSLPFQRGMCPLAGVIDADSLSEGIHRYRIECKDLSGNVSVVEGTFISTHRKKINIVEIDSSSVYLSGNISENFERLYIEGRNSRTGKWENHAFSKEQLISEFGRTVIHFNTSMYDIIKARTKDKWNHFSSPAYKVLRDLRLFDSNISVETEYYRDFVRIDLRTNGIFTNPSAARLTQGDSILPIPFDIVDINYFSAPFIPYFPSYSNHSIQYSLEVNGAVVNGKKLLSLFAIPSNKHGWFSIDNGTLQVMYDSGAVFQPLILQVHADRNGNEMAYKFEPRDVLLNRGLKIAVRKPNSSLRNPALYLRTGHNWEFNPTQFDSTTQYYTTTITHTLGDVALLDDAIPPWISTPRISWLGRILNVRFSIGDQLSGIDGEGIQVFLDGQFLIPEVDGRWRVNARSERALERGTHRLVIRARDKAGNKLEVERTLRTP